ncbi:MAG: potassium transporter TrkG [Candidatus Fermentibacteria bacterium]|nr:potassium transporter TrkG [Candidatus Fermentibacteria bacterium]
MLDLKKILLEWPLSMYNVVTIIALILLRYLFRFDSAIVLSALQISLFFEAAGLFTAVLSSTRGWNDIKSRPWQMILSLFFIAGGLTALITGELNGSIHVWGISKVVNVYLLSMAFLRVFSHLIRLASNISPALILGSSFTMVILLGAALLLTPRATTSGISPVDALFTSASATCVTGLIVLDTGTDFTFAGQLIILLLVQVGGLGIMTFAAFFALSFGQQMGLAGARNLSRLMDSEFTNDLKHILLSILIWTLIIETAGALLLYNTWSGIETLGWSTQHTVWQSIFHSISAFCNAGFSLNTTNIELFANSPSTSLIIGTLIVLGGLGFMLLTTLGRHWLLRMRAGRKRILPVQTRFVLIITAILIILGSGLFLAMEWNNTLAGMSIWQKLANSYLQGVTTRTAGFNTVPTSSLISPVKWFFLIFMFIGASPGGTGGGVKTTTIGLLILSLRSLVLRRKTPEIWNRQIPNFDLQRAGAILLIGMATFGISSFLLLITETGHGSEAGFSSMDYIFESMSAFGTVGLSTGVTQKLSAAGKWIIIVTMFIGRTAPATLAAATSRVKTSLYSYPEARITIG